jgi:hypothetical protein
MYRAMAGTGLALSVGLALFMVYVITVNAPPMPPLVMLLALVFLGFAVLASVFFWWLVCHAD